ncbi:hypothetical protein [Halorubellus litoreus]|uniref:Uncharacterized protein n=1 Tax=Halorubellus litoreus TaxID=755308 RepID=A0ABD5V8D3_9EURY
MSRVPRRRLLARAAAGTAAALGVAGTTTALIDDDRTPAEQFNAAIEPCPGDAEKADPYFVVRGSGPMDGMVLQSDDVVAIGDSLTVSLVNESTESRTTGLRWKRDIHHRVGDRWHTVLGNEWGGYGGPQPGHEHAPGEGFRWTFPFDREGIETSLLGDSVRVCGPVEPGRYRFVFWGINPVDASSNGVEHDLVIGTEFDVVEPPDASR